MSKGEKVAVFVWTLMVLVGTFLILHSNLKARTYRGKKVSFTTDSDWYVDIHTIKPVRIEAANSRYFRIVQGETHLYGLPTEPPLNYASDDYFYLEAGMQRGRWEIAKGSSTSIRLIGEESFDVIHSPSSSEVTFQIGVGAFLGIILWLIGFLLLLGLIDY